MNSLSKKLGYWSAVTILGSFIIYVLCFVGILLSSDMFIWSNLKDYLKYYQENSQVLAELARAFMIVMAIAYVVLINSLHEEASSERKVFSRLSLSFGIAFLISISIHYFVQISAIRFAISEVNRIGLEHFIQANPHSVFSSINMLGWTLFFGLSSLFMVSNFDKSLKLLRLGFLLNGLNGIIGMFAFVFDIIPILAFTAYIGLGAFVLMISIGSIKLFR